MAIFPGTPNNDTIVGGADDDTITASAGNDIILGGAGRDTFIAGAPVVGYSFSDPDSRIADNVQSVGDIDGDGRGDFLISTAEVTLPGGNGAPGVYFVSGQDLLALDGAGGDPIDGLIDLADIILLNTGNSFAIAGGTLNSATGADQNAAGDVTGDGVNDLLIGAENDPANGNLTGVAYLISGDDLGTLDGADGANDGIIDLSVTTGFENNGEVLGYQFIGEASGDVFGRSLDITEDLDGDGGGELLIAAPGNDTNGNVAGSVYLISSQDLAALDDVTANGGTQDDGDIEVENINATVAPNSYQFLGAGSVDIVGNSVAAVDINGDGTEDFVFGALGGDGAGTFSGDFYVIDGTELDALDPNNDNIIDLGDVATLGTSSFQINGEVAEARLARNAQDVGDVTGDGDAEFLISGAFGFGADGAPQPANSGAFYLINGDDLASAAVAAGPGQELDVADVIANGANSYKFYGNEAFSILSNDDGYTGHIGDLDGDGKNELLISTSSADVNGDVDGGVTYLISSQDLVTLDNMTANGGVAGDGLIELENVAGSANSYVFLGDAGDQFSRTLSSVDDVNGDGLDDLLFGSLTAGSDGAAEAGGAFLIRSSDLAALDQYTTNGGTAGDRIIELANVVDGGTGLSVTVNNDGDGSVTSDLGVDTVESVEDFVAGGDVPNGSITITDTDVDGAADETGIRFLPSEIMIDAAATGTFTNKAGVVTAFGPGTGAGPGGNDILLSEILNVDGAFRFGEIQISGGVDSGQVGNITFDNFAEVNFSIVCFARGTLITTPDGERPVEELAAGDQVVTMDTGDQPIRWIGSHALDSIDLAVNPKLRPIRIRANALGEGYPERDLIVSRQHRLLVRSIIARRMFDTEEILVPANKLLALDGVEVVEENPDGVEYFHFLFDKHEIVWSNGLPTESLFTGPEALRSVPPESRAELETLFPALTAADHMSAPARPIPNKGRMIKNLALRHRKNAMPLFNPAKPLESVRHRVE